MFINTSIIIDDYNYYQLENVFQAKLLKGELLYSKTCQ